MVVGISFCLALTLATALMKAVTKRVSFVGHSPLQLPCSLICPGLNRQGGRFYFERGKIHPQICCGDRDLTLREQKMQTR